MFRNQIQDLLKMQEVMEGEILTLEESLKKQKEELRDVKQALASLERIQSKYDTQDEEVECVE
ncbi:MAG: hypothetical protein J6D12_02295 [Peptostreptococcaceae bacterium]|nr:hypothetical protein [Peptostreptococcaceae bacterium]